MFKDEIAVEACIVVIEGVVHGVLIRQLHPHLITPGEVEDTHIPP